MPKPLSEKDRFLLGQPPICDQLPVRFEDTDFKITHIGGTCGDCGRDIEDRDFRGTVKRPFDFVVTIEARGVCRHCKRASAYVFHVRQDDTITYRCGNGPWRNSRMVSKEPLMKRIFSLVLRPFSR